MAFNMNLWRVSGSALVETDKTRLDYENRLENWLVDDPSVLGIELLIIGRQVSTEFGGRIDLLGIDQQGDLVILELKRDRTPREIVAQVLEYASWVRNLTYEEINAISSKFLKEGLSVAFSKNFGGPLPDTINTNHSMVIVASELDESSERIVQYLTDEYRVNINAAFFTFFKDGEQEFLGRAWLRDPEQVQEISGPRKRPPWPGYWFVNVGEGPHRNWDDNKDYGYIGAGQGAWFSRALQRLNVGDEIFAYMRGRGYVGYGKVAQRAVMIKEFMVEKEGKPLLDLPLQATNPGENRDDPELSDWAVGVTWIKTYSREDAKTFAGIFANPHIVCKLRHEATVEFLKQEFGVGG